MLAVKENQPTLCEAIRNFFREHLEDDLQRVAHRNDETHEQGHGRIDDRYYHLAKLPKDFAAAADWAGLEAIGMAVRVTDHSEGHESSDVRYYIASEYLSGKRFAEAVLSHWSIENSLHWQLDVTFGEDHSRSRAGHADANMSLLRRTARSLLMNSKTTKVGVKNKRLAAGWDDDYRMQVLCGA